MSHSSHPQSRQIKALLRRDGTLNVHAPRNMRKLFNDLYHYFFALSWPSFFVHILAVYLFINFVFAVLYFMAGVLPVGVHAEGLEHFKECFLLSVETTTAIEYSRIQPSGWFTYVIMTLQALWGILTIAMITGLFYARFSRPSGRLIFSNKAIIALHNGRRSLSFRVANERLNQIAEAHMSLTLTKNETSDEGETTRKFYDLKLERDHSPLFALSWTVRHHIDEDSPLFGMDDKAMHDVQAAILASLSGIDDTFAQPIMARHSYAPDDIVYNRRFKDIIIWYDKKVHIDLMGIHDLHEAAPQA